MSRVDPKRLIEKAPPGKSAQRASSAHHQQYQSFEAAMGRRLTHQKDAGDAGNGAFLVRDIHFKFLAECFNFRYSSEGLIGEGHTQ